MTFDTIFLLATLIMPGIFILPWRVRYRLAWGFVRLGMAAVVAWPIIAVVGVRAVDAEQAAVQAKIQAQQARGETPDQHDLMFDGTGDRVAFGFFGWIFPALAGLPMLLVRFLIDLWLHPKHAWEDAIREREWAERAVS